MARTPEPFSPERLLAALRELPAASRWWVAFSGGADSTALLHALWLVRDHLDAPLLALHVDHGLHPRSATWGAACAKFCAERSIPIRNVKIAVSRETRLGVEAEARRLRYAAAADNLRTGDILLTGHHADDQAETLLLNLMRGSGPDGLAGMPRIRPLGEGLLARPLLDFSGRTLRDFLRGQGLGWIEDASNLDPAYDRNFIRSELMPMLEERWPGARRNLATSARYCREASDFLTDSAQRAVRPCLPIDPVLDLDCLATTDPGPYSAGALKLIVRHWLRINQAPPLPSRRLEELLRQVADGKSGRQITIRWAGWVVHAHQGCLWAQPENRIPPCPTRAWDAGEPLELGAVLGRLSLAGSGQPPRSQLLVRSRHPGDRIRCLPGGRSRTVKQVLNEAGIPPWLRESIPMVLDGDELLSVAGRLDARGPGGWLTEQGLQLHWEPADPLLKFALERWRPGDG